jgi:hypothetical protein
MMITTTTMLIMAIIPMASMITGEGSRSARKVVRRTLFAETKAAVSP